MYIYFALKHACVFAAHYPIHNAMLLIHMHSQSHMYVQYQCYNKCHNIINNMVLCLIIQSAHCFIASVCIMVKEYGVLHMCLR